MYGRVSVCLGITIIVIVIIIIIIIIVITVVTVIVHASDGLGLSYGTGDTALQLFGVRAT